MLCIGVSSFRYAHAVLMLAGVLDSVHQKIVADVVAKHNATYNGGRGTAKHTRAPPKAFARVMTKVFSDYRDRDFPRAQHNVDVIRCLVSADSPEELLALSKALDEAFGGAVRYKNLFAASPSERAERFHLLTVMLTVMVDSGTLLGELMQMPDVRKTLDAYVVPLLFKLHIIPFVRGSPYYQFESASINLLFPFVLSYDQCESDLTYTLYLFLRYVSARDPTLPPHRWAETTARARAMLKSDALASLQARLLGEVQLVLTTHSTVRHKMHEVYKAYRAESAERLWEDFARTAVVEGTML